MSIPLSKKQLLTQVCAEFCADDLRPFRFIQGDGFYKLADMLISIRAEYGKISSKSVLPHVL
jgi:Hermes transposase DNA-binding domain